MNMWVDQHFVNDSKTPIILEDEFELVFLTNFYKVLLSSSQYILKTFKGDLQTFHIYHFKAR